MITSLIAIARIKNIEAHKNFQKYYDLEKVSQLPLPASASFFGCLPPLDQPERPVLPQRGCAPLLPLLPRGVPRLSLMPMTICVIVPGLGGYPSFRGFRATQYTYPPAPISPDPESTRQLQQVVKKGACAGEVGAWGAERGAGLAEVVPSGSAATLPGSKSWDTEEPMFRDLTSARKS